MTILSSYSRIPLLQLMHCFKPVRPYFQLFCLSMTTCHRQTLSVSRNSVTRWCIVVLFGTSLSAYAFLNASRTAANDFDTKLCSIMNTLSGNQGDIDSSVTGEVGRVHYTGVDLLLISFLYRST
jgi:hypothetical protein